MKKHTFTLILIVLLSHVTIGQKLVKSFSKDVCTCINKEKGKNESDASDLFQKCVEVASYSNEKELKKEFANTASGDQKSVIKEFMTKVSIELMATCKDFADISIKIYNDKLKNKEENGDSSKTETMESSQKLDESSFKIESDKISNIKSGRHAYVTVYFNGTAINRSTVGAGFEFKNNATKYYEYEGEGKYLVYSVIWKSSTTAEMTLIDKKNGDEYNLFKIGDKETFNIKSTANDIYYVEHFVPKLGIKSISEVKKE